MAESQKIDAPVKSKEKRSLLGNVKSLTFLIESGNARALQRVSRLISLSKYDSYMVHKQMKCNVI
ncbi:hypothetical protein Hanom_Chr11g00982061 [Helianthus anomalus]